MAKQEKQFGIIDDENDCLLDSDVYSSYKDAIDYATELCDECDEDTSCTVVELIPVFRVKRNTKVIVEKL